eukprot:6521000-Alexandrium_andersonii.AAC.1
MGRLGALLGLLSIGENGLRVLSLMLRDCFAVRSGLRRLRSTCSHHRSRRSLCMLTAHLSSTQARRDV